MRSVSKKDSMFVSRCFGPPEQREFPLAREAAQKLVPRPEITEEQRAEMHFRIYDSVQYDYRITVQWFQPVHAELGVIASARGVVKAIDAANIRFQLVDGERVWWIGVEDVVGVKK